MNIGDLCEICHATHPRRGTECVIHSIDGKVATVWAFDTVAWRYTGELFEVHLHLLLVLPTPTDLNRARTKLRAEHIARLLPRKEARTPAVRVFKQHRSRNKASDY